MLRNLLPLGGILLIASGIGYFMVVSPKIAQNPVSNTVAPQSVPKDNNLESRVDFLETTLTSLKDQISKLGSSAPVNTKLTIDPKITELENKLNKLDSRVSTLESTPAQGGTTTTIQKSTQYIPMGNGSSSTAMDWTAVPLPEVTINSADYSGYTNAYLEVQMLVDQGNGTAYARLYNNTDGTAILGSEIFTTSYNYTTVTSGAFKLSSGNKTYKLQLKTSTGYASNVQFARIKITY